MSALDEKRFTALGREFVARFDFNAMCAVEEARGGRGFLEIAAPFLQQLGEGERDDPVKAVEAAQRLKFADIRLILCEALRGAEPAIVPADAGEIIADLGIAKAMEIVAWAIVKAVGSGDEGGNDAGGGATGAADPPNRATRRKAG